MNMKLLASLCILGAVSLAVHAAPPGWELRNGNWVPVVQPGTDTPDAQVALMQADLTAGKHDEVVSAAQDWVKVNKLHPLMPQVLLLQGDAEVARGNRYRALYSYEDLLNNYPNSELYLPAVEREFFCAASFLKGYKRKFLGMRIIGVTDDALEVLDRIQDRVRGSPLAERAGILAADYYYEDGQFPEAVQAYADFIKRYPYSQFVRKAEIRRAEASLATFRGVLYDFTPLINARERLGAISKAYPQAAEGLQVRAIEDRIYQLEGRKELEIARYYYRAGKLNAAAYYYRRVIKNWPDTVYARQAKEEMVKRAPEYAEK
jgi:outer membrane assembly lipoprotein YfiO